MQIIVMIMGIIQVLNPTETTYQFYYKKGKPLIHVVYTIIPCHQSTLFLALCTPLIAVGYTDISPQIFHIYINNHLPPIFYFWYINFYTLIGI